MGDDGILYYPSEQSKLGKLKAGTAETIGHAPEIALSTGLAPFGPGASVAGAIVGTGIRAAIGERVYGEKKTTKEHLIDYGVAGGSALIGHGGSGKAVGAIDRTKGRQGARLMKTAGRDRFRMSRDKVIKMEALAKKHDVEIFASQATGSNELIARFNLLGDMPVTADKIFEARIKQLKQVNDSVENYLRQFGPDTLTAESAGKGAVKASQKGIKSATTIRQNKAGPLYKKAFDKTPEIDQQLAVLTDGYDLLEKKYLDSLAKADSARAIIWLYRTMSPSITSLLLVRRFSAS